MIVLVQLLIRTMSTIVRPANGKQHDTFIVTQGILYIQRYADTIVM